LFRGGSWLNGSQAGVFAVAAGDPPSFLVPGIGFRCAR